MSCKLINFSSTDAYRGRGVRGGHHARQAGARGRGGTIKIAKVVVLVAVLVLALELLLVRMSCDSELSLDCQRRF